MSEVNDKFARGLSVFSFVIALAAFGFTLYVHCETNVEKLSINVQRIYGDYPTEMKPVLNGTDTLCILNSYWICTLTNNSDKTISIIDYDLIDKKENGQYPWLKQHIFEDSLYKTNDLVQIYLPIDLEPGKSKRALIKIGLKISPYAYRVIENKYGTKNISIKKIEQYLETLNIDIYKDSLINKTQNDTTVRLLTLSSKKGQTFILYFITARKNLFKKEFSWYDSYYSFVK